MRERITARVLLLDPANRLALMRFLSPNTLGRPHFWATIGGELEPGETLSEAALREMQEETGLTPSWLGPVVWYGEVVLPIDGEPHLFKESYFLARCDSTMLSRAGWTEIERRSADEVRWWSLEEIAASHEAIYPPRLAELLPGLVAGDLPPQPLVLYAGAATSGS